MILTVFLVALLQAQEDQIHYTDFIPDLSISALTATNDGDTIKIDIDQDGTVDFKMYIGVMNSTMVRHVFVTSSWYFRFCYNSIHSYGFVDENDSLVSEPHAPGNWGAPNTVWPLLWEPDNTHYMELMMGFRKTAGNENYYAWSRIYMYKNPEGQGHNPSYGDFDIVIAYCDNMAYCSIPNYPLRWGQTEFWGVQETASSNFATIQPNPVTGVVTIMGKNLRQVEVYDILGQNILSVKTNNSTTTIDLTGHPSGMYFINITDQNGVRCVKKIVKQ